MTSLLLIVVGLAAGLGGGYVFRTKMMSSKNSELLERSEKVLKDAENKANSMILDAKQQAIKMQEDLQAEERQKRAELQKSEERLLKKESDLEDKIESLEKKRDDLDNKITEANELKSKAKEALDKQSEELERIAALSKEEAKEQLFKKIEEMYQEELVDHIKAIKKKAEAEADEKSKMILAQAMQKYAAETSAENTATMVKLPSDDMKGRIIGREGRNISTFEQITGVDVIVDDTPGVVIISGFDLLRRYIAKVSLERLLTDGRIHPARIEEVVLKVKDEVSELIKELGERAAYETGVVGLPPELVKLLGRLKFRTTRGQNVLKHSMEVAYLAEALAVELGADVSACKKAALLHDIGKAVDHEISGHHAQIGSDICRKFGLPEKICNIIGAHHGNPEPESLEAIVVQVANEIAANRTGVGKDNLESFIKRMDDMENIAKGFDGVTKAYALNTGQSVRVLVNPDNIDDLGAVKMAHDIAKKIENDMGHTGEVKVDVIRETRVEEIAE